MKIVDVDPASPLFGQIRAGYTLLMINNKKVEDTLDFCFKVSQEKIKLTFADPQRRIITFAFNDILPGQLGLRFEDDRIKTCKNNCLFCFVRQQPRGMRRQLYIRDEDYRLSFTHGNFITLSNLERVELDRIVRQRLSPLYVSVHTTDEALRRFMLGNRKLPSLMPQMRFLVKNRITLHTQVVLCPGINDGAHLDRTIDDLAGLFPQTATLAVVPVGLTRYREKLPVLRPFTRKEAGDIITYLESRQKVFLKKLGSRFVWPADEFYVLAGRSFPRRNNYEQMAQFENGVGMVREFLSVFNRHRKRLRKVRTSRRILFLTGYSAFPFMRDEIMPYLTQELRLKSILKKVANRFWGKNVTVSGLLTGRDLLRAALSERANFDVAVLPPNCLNRDDLFLDDMSRQEFTTRLKKKVIVGQYNLVNSMIEALS